MLNFTTLLNRPSVFLSFTGMKINEFYAILDKFASLYEADKQQRFYGKKLVVRQIGGGDKEKLETIEDKLLFILVYCKCYPIQELHGFLFGMSQESANEWIHRLTPILNQSLGYMNVLPKRKIRSMHEFLELFPDAREFFVDGVERPIQRSAHYETQKKDYSGKKHRHMIKNIVMTNKRKEILFLSSTSPGSCHDKKLLDDETIPYPPDTTGMMDLGFLGYTHPNLRGVLPHKKPKGKELTESQKEQNTIVGSIRISVEHAIGGMKRNHIVSDTFRNHKKEYEDDVVLISAGLHNLRVISRNY